MHMRDLEHNLFQMLRLMLLEELILTFLVVLILDRTGDSTESDEDDTASSDDESNPEDN